MKLLVQSDDYGMTRAVAAGIVQGIKNGIIRNTGMFINMPWSSEVVEWIYPYLDQIAFGIDLNASTGSALLSHDEIPSLTHEDGSFLTSRENRALDTDENDHDHVNYAELYKEFDAQIKEFVELTGRLPDYLHGHAYLTKTSEKVIMDLAEKYNRPYAGECIQRLYGRRYEKMSWVKMGNAAEQLQSDLKGYIFEHNAEWLQSEMIYLVTHCGYCDSELVDMSSFNVLRIKDLEALCSDEVKSWVKDNDIELITFKQLAEYKDTVLD